MNSLDPILRSGIKVVGFIGNGVIVGRDFAPMFALNLWGFAAGLVFGLGVVNPFAWLNGKRLIFACMAFAMILGRVAGGGIAELGLAMPMMNQALVFIATPFVLLFAGATVILTLSLLAAVVFCFFIGIPVVIANQIFAFEHSLQIYRYKANSLAGHIVKVVLWLRNEQPPAAGPDDSKGARFATGPEIAALHRLGDPAAMAFGHVGNPLFLKTDKHVLIMASTRSGKGVTLIIPHLLRYQGSAFVLDPKGENAKATIRQRTELNDKVHVLDPFGITGLPQARFNPLSRFTPENMEAESKALAAALFVLADGERRDHWIAAGQQRVALLIL
jgi:type IV secretion system protein VirD4